MKRLPVLLDSPCPRCAHPDPYAIQYAINGCVECRFCGQWGYADPSSVRAMQADASAAALRILDLVVAGVAIEMERRERVAAA